MACVRNGSLPHDAYTFTAVDDTSVVGDFPELNRLWDLVRNDEERREGIGPEDNTVLGALLGVGGEGSGIMFHAHEFAIAAQLAGHKRWFVYDDYNGGSPSDDFMSRQFKEARRRNPAFTFNSAKAWASDVLPLPEVQLWWRKVGWACVQASFRAATSLERPPPSRAPQLTPV